MEKLGDKLLINDEKARRAKDLVELLGRPAKTDNEIEQKERFGELVAGAKVKDEDRLLFIYEKLGGLVRTIEEEKVHQKKVEESKKKRFPTK